jgi:hypothetical protein
MVTKPKVKAPVRKALKKASPARRPTSTKPKAALPTTLTPVLKKRVVKRLHLKEHMALARLVEAGYKSSDLDDASFADRINKAHDLRSQFKFDLNAGHIAAACELAGISPNREVRRVTTAESMNTLTARVGQLEEQLSALTTYIMGKGKE